MKKLLSVLLIVVMSFALFSGIAFAKTGEIIKWSEPKTTVYDKLHPYTLNWSGDPLDRGGLVLSTMEITSSSSEADIVINQYGAMGASGIIRLGNEDLETETDSSIAGFKSSVDIEKDCTYLVVLHDGKFAKIRIDRFLPEQGISINKVFFTYVIEKERVKDVSSAPSAPSAPNTPSTPSAPNVPNVPGQPPQDYPKDPWSDDYVVPVPEQASAPFEIYLSINNTYATIYNKQNQKIEYRLHTVPFLYEGRTMVPLRFVAEALGAVVEWHPEDQAISIVNNDTIIVLWINEKYANVNGHLYELDVPPIIKDQYTMVPLRFISENFSMYVYYNNGQILITDVENKYFETSDVAIGQTIIQPTPANNASIFVGRWNLWLPGTFAPGNQYVQGVNADWVEVFADGSYQWLYLKKIYEGTWYDSGVEGVIKIKNPPVTVMGEDWTMSLQEPGLAKIYAWGMEYVAVKVTE